MTNSIAFPNMFDVTRSRVSTLSDNASIVNRSRLLILTSPTELYNEPNFGVGLKQFLFQYNTENQKAIIRDKIAEQLRLHEPCCDADGTQYADGLMFTGEETNLNHYNKLEMTVAIQTKFGNLVSVDFSDLQEVIDYTNSTMFEQGGVSEWSNQEV